MVPFFHGSRRGCAGTLLPSPMVFVFCALGSIGCGDDDSGGFPPYAYPPADAADDPSDGGLTDAPSDVGDASADIAIDGSLAPADASFDLGTLPDVVSDIGGGS